MPTINDYINKLDETTHKLEDAKTLLWSVCENYFSERKETIREDTLKQAIVLSDYGTFSDLSYMAGRMLFDIVDDYRKLSDELSEYSAALRKAVEGVS
jgi:hypothetical protein